MTQEEVQAMGDAMVSSYRAMEEMRKSGMTWREIEATVEGRNDWFAIHLRSNVKTFEWSEKRDLNRRIRLSIILEKDLVP